MHYIASCSFGKDSLAQIIKIKELGLPLDEVIFYDIRFTDKVSGEHPLLAEWIPKAEKILKDEFDLEVKHITADKTFYEYFYTVKQKGNHVGDIYGYPFVIGAWCNHRLKVSVISKYINSIKDDIHQYVGIAYDEPNRYIKIKNKESKRVKYSSVLYDNQITEIEAFSICKEYNLVSPHYEKGYFRGGCWFCVKQSLSDLYLLWRDYPIYFSTLMSLEKDSHNTFKPNKSIFEINQRFESGFVPNGNEKFNKLQTLSHTESKLFL